MEHKRYPALQWLQYNTRMRRYQGRVMGTEAHVVIAVDRPSPELAKGSRDPDVVLDYLAAAFLGQWLDMDTAPLNERIMLRYPESNPVAGRPVLEIQASGKWDMPRRAWVTDEDVVLRSPMGWRPLV